MSKIIIVDKNDNVIGSKERGTVDGQKDICRLAGLWLANSKGEALLAQRKFSKKYNPGKWGPAVGGTVEEDETYESNIYKEAKEEIGLTDVQFVKERKFFMATPNKTFCQFFSAVVDRPIENFNIQEEEVEAIKWINKDELIEEIKNNPDQFTEGVRYYVVEK